MTAVATLRALADPVRLDILELLAARSAVTATQLAERLPITRQAVSRHIGILESAGLVAGERRGREQCYSVDPKPIEAAADWLSTRARSWDRALHRLAQHLDS